MSLFRPSAFAVTGSTASGAHLDARGLADLAAEIARAERCKTDDMGGKPPG